MADIFAPGGIVEADCEKIHAILAEIPFHPPLGRGAVFPCFERPGFTTEITEGTEETKKDRMKGDEKTEKTQRQQQQGLTAFEVRREGVMRRQERTFRRYEATLRRNKAT